MEVDTDVMVGCGDVDVAPALDLVLRDDAVWRLRRLPGDGQCVTICGDHVETFGRRWRYKCQQPNKSFLDRQLSMKTIIDMT